MVLLQEPLAIKPRSGFMCFAILRENYIFKIKKRKNLFTVLAKAEEKVSVHLCLAHCCAESSVWLCFLFLVLRQDLMWYRLVLNLLCNREWPLNFRFSCLCFLRTRITDMFYHHIWFYVVLCIKSRAFCMLGKHSTNWTRSLYLNRLLKTFLCVHAHVCVRVFKGEYALFLM